MLKICDVILPLWSSVDVIYPTTPNDERACYFVDLSPITPFIKTVKRNHKCNLHALRYRHQKLSFFHISYLLYSLHLYFCYILAPFLLSILWCKFHPVFLSDLSCSAAQLLRHHAQIWLVLIEMGPNLVGTDYIITYHAQIWFSWVPLCSRASQLLSHRAQIWLLLIEMGPNLVGTDYVITYRAQIYNWPTVNRQPSVQKDQYCRFVQWHRAYPYMGMGKHVEEQQG